MSPICEHFDSIEADKEKHKNISNKLHKRSSKYALLKKDYIALKTKLTETNEELIQHKEKTNVL